jgi:hypothetical protein
VALVSKSAEQRADECLITEEVGPFGIIEICGNNRGTLAIPLFHQFEEDVGLLRAQI